MRGCAQADAASEAKQVRTLPHSSFFLLAVQVKTWEEVRLQVARHFGARASVRQDSHLLSTFIGVVCNVVARPHIC